MRQLMLIFALAAATIPTLACEDDNPMSPSDITGVTWRLTLIDLPGEDPIIVSEPNDYTLEFDDDGTVDIKFDCNGCSGLYTADDEDIEFEDIVCTDAACGAGSLDPEIILSLLDVNTISIDEDDEEMILSGSGVTLTFEQ